MRINLIEKINARKGGRYFLACTLIQGAYFETEGFSRTKAIRELKKIVRKGQEAE